METDWLAWAKRLHGIATSGLHYGADDFDIERYRAIADIAEAMLASIGSVPIERIQGLIHESTTGYATPKVEVRGAVIRHEKILLVREKSDGRWTLPGGFADVGHSAAENIAKEVWEEAGIRVAATRLYGLRHKARHGYDPDVRDFYKLFFLCEQIDELCPSPGPEVTDVGFFALDGLPALSTSRVLERDLHAAFDCHAGRELRALFD